MNAKQRRNNRFLEMIKYRARNKPASPASSQAPWVETSNSKGKSKGKDKGKKRGKGSCKGKGKSKNKDKTSKK